MDGYVVKVGGSLADILPDLVSVFKSCRMRLVIVPGGGAGADAVRLLDPDPDSAHWMAISAMEQYGHRIASLGIPPIDGIVPVSHPSVLLPYCLLRREDPLPHSWDVTSDTIAAWAAWRFSLPLIVLKSVDGIIADGRKVDIIASPLATDTVDYAFIPFILEHNVKAAVINGRRKRDLLHALSGDFSSGTYIPRRTEGL
ncbi:uridylate kinase [Methanocalculus taiwanensis]|uniref:Uridylate kinase n=1 Tax=Methanocalculus taiwanensis TaxID=106207 RepID=A0ABD4TQ49_9EURY|nr:uridylate kinase [Methanocalculus taiwanensis]MCQ1539430.1 uridylate kinase [Methanocalculus taiwanensis]